MCKGLDAVISVTPHICDYFSNINPNTWMITNYPILEEIVEANRNPRTLCFAGGINEQWRHEQIIKAIDGIESCNYIICGCGTDDYIVRLSFLPGWHKVDFKGKIPHLSVNSVLSSCSVGLSVLEYNNNTGFKTGTLGNTKLFEKMMAGLPVICTDFDLWREIIEKYHCGICVNPDSVEEIREAIIYLFEHPEEATQMGKNGRKAVEEKFNWNSQEAILLELYKKLS